MKIKEIDTQNGFKKCNYCLEIKPLLAFSYRTDANCFRSYCKTCKNQQNRNLALKKRNKLSLFKKESVLAKDLRNSFKFCNKCFKELSINLFEFRKDAYVFRTFCKSCHQKMNLSWSYKNKDIIKQYTIKHKEKRNKRCRRYNKLISTKAKVFERYRNDINYKLKKLLRSRINKALKATSHSKISKTSILLGCTIDQFKHHLESQFSSEMNWNNMGPGYLIDNRGKPVHDNMGNTIPVKQWHIDHIKPCYLFDFTKPEDQIKCFHYSNLRPLWAADNLRRSRKVTGINSN